MPLADVAGPFEAGHPEEADAGLGLFARSCALNEALDRKKLRTDQLGHAEAGQASGEGGGFQRGRLHEWASLAAQHAPPVRKGQHRHAVPGGLQDAYVHAVRRYLTEASLACQGSHTEAPPQQAAAAPAVDGALVPVDPVRAACLVLAVVDASDALEGTLVSATLLDGAVANHQLGSGGTLRLILHRRHPLLQQSGDWLPRAGDGLIVRGFQVVARGAGGRGPLLMPVEVSLSGQESRQGTPEPRGRGTPRPAWECLDV